MSVVKVKLTGSLYKKVEKVASDLKMSVQDAAVFLVLKVVSPCDARKSGN